MAARIVVEWPSGLTTPDTIAVRFRASPVVLFSFLFFFSLGTGTGVLPPCGLHGEGGGDGVFWDGWLVEGDMEWGAAVFFSFFFSRVTYTLESVLLTNFGGDMGVQLLYRYRT